MTNFVKGSLEDRDLITREVWENHRKEFSVIFEFLKMTGKPFSFWKTPEKIDVVSVFKDVDDGAEKRFVLWTFNRKRS